MILWTVAELWGTGAGVKIAAVFAISYLIGGVCYVSGDMRLPVSSQPAYVRCRGLSAFMLVASAWILSAIYVLSFAGSRSKHGRHALLSLVVFVLALVVGTFLRAFVAIIGS